MTAKNASRLPWLWGQGCHEHTYTETLIELWCFYVLKWPLSTTLFTIFRCKLCSWQLRWQCFIYLIGICEEFLFWDLLFCFGSWDKYSMCSSTWPFEFLLGSASQELWSVSCTTLSKSFVDNTTNTIGLTYRGKV